MKRSKVCNFSLPVLMCRRAVALPRVRVGVGAASALAMLKFYVRVFYVMGKAVSGKLSSTETCLASSPVCLYRKSYCTALGSGMALVLDVYSNMFKDLH